MSSTFTTPIAVGSGSSSNSTSADISLGDTTGATLITVGCTSSFLDPTVIDNKGNTYSLRGMLTVGSDRIAIFDIISPIVGSGHIVTVGGIAPGGSAQAWTGQAASSPFDQISAGAITGGVSTIQPGSITPSQGNELIFAVSGWGGVTDPMLASIDSGFTITSQAHGINTPGFGSGSGAAYLIQSTAAPINPTFTMNASNSLRALQASYKDQSSPSSRGLFQSSPLSGIGIGGSFFRDPLQSKALQREVSLEEIEYYNRRKAS